MKESFLFKSVNKLIDYINMNSFPCDGFYLAPHGELSIAVYEKIKLNNSVRIEFNGFLDKNKKNNTEYPVVSYSAISRLKNKIIIVCHSVYDEEIVNNVKIASGEKNCVLNLSDYIEYEQIDIKLSYREYDKAVFVTRLDAIGDFILWLYSAKYYREIFKNKRIILISNGLWAGFAEGFDCWDEVWSIDVSMLRTSKAYRKHINDTFEKISPYKIINPTFSRAFEVDDYIVSIINAQEKIGFDGDLSNISIDNKTKSDRWYDSLIAIPDTVTHEIHKNIFFINQLSSTCYSPSMPSFEIKGNKALLPEKKYCILFPGAGWDSKRWKNYNYSFMVEYIYKTMGVSVVLSGSEKELNLGEDIVNLISDKSIDVINLIGKTSLDDVFLLIKNAMFIIGNDSSCIHIAAQLSVPFVCVMGGGHYERFVPYPKDFNNERMFFLYKKEICYGCQWKCIYPLSDGTVRCVASIGINDVISALSKLAIN